MILWILSTVAIFLILRFLWRAYTHPANVLGRQAANMNWRAIGRINGEKGFKDVCFERDGVEACVSHARGDVYLLKPVHSTPFKDFVELERWLAGRMGSLPGSNNQTYVPQDKPSGSLDPKESSGRPSFYCTF